MASTGEVWRLGHRPALDGLRGVAILLVVADHCLPDTFHAGGSVGVTLFFTLSGFLITTILLEERESTGAVSLGRFYTRRARRLLPALVVFVLVAVGVGLTISTQIATPASAVPVLLYFANFPLASGGPVNAFGHTWSLAIEEQFYLLWPLVLVVTRSRRTLFWGLTAAAATVVTWRATLWMHGATAERVYYSTDTRCDALLIGCALAVVLHGRLTWRSRLGTALVAVAGMIALGFLQLNGGMYVIVPTVVPLLAAIAIVGAVGEREAGALDSSLLRWFGRRSYGLYLWHAPILYFGLRALPTSWLSVAILLAASLVVTWASWRYVEQPVLQSRSRRPVAQPSVVAARVEPAAA